MLLTRAEAGRRLAEGLKVVALEGAPVVLAISRSGARVAAEVAQELGAPLDMMCARRLEVPGRPHSMFGAVADGALRLDQAAIARLGLPQDYVEQLSALAMHEAETQTRTSRGVECIVPVEGRVVILVDDGFAEAVLLEAAIGAAREAGAVRVVLATPVLTTAERSTLAGLVNDLLVLYEGDAASQVVVCDTQFAQTTAFDLQNLIERSRRASVVPA